MLIGPRDIEAAAAHLRAGLADIVARPADERGVMRRAAARRTDAPERHCASCGLLEACALSRDAEVLPAERHRYPTPPELAGVIPAPSGA